VLVVLCDMVLLELTVASGSVKDEHLLIFFPKFLDLNSV
jgi:hypothetical protein